MKFDIQEIIKIRRRLHQYPEYAWDETITSDILLEYFRNKFPIKLTTNIADSPSFAVQFRGVVTGKKVMIRCELDALPIKEDMKIPHRSLHKGLSHKCGHDGHMAVMCGLADIFHDKPLIKGEVMIVFQSAEETGEGAAHVLDDIKDCSDAGIIDFNPDYIFAMHNLPGYPLGQIIVKEGGFASASEGMIIKLKGASSHAAEPEKGRNPALAIADIIRTLHDTEGFYNDLPPGCKAVVIDINMGEEDFGISPGDAVLMVTLRAPSDDDITVLRERLRGEIKKLTKEYGLKYTTKRTEIFPSIVNHPQAVKIVKEAAKALKLSIIKPSVPLLFSDDFGHFGRDYKCCYFGIGAGVDHPPLHHPDYDFPDEIIENSVGLFYKMIQIAVNE